MKKTLAVLILCSLVSVCYADAKHESTNTPVVVSVVQSNCLNPEWQADCDSIGNCRFNSSQAVGCEKINNVCNECARGYGGDPPPEEGGNRATTNTIPFNPETQFIGYFEPFTYKYKGKAYRYARFRVSVPGILSKLNIVPGDVLRRMNAGRLTIRRLNNTFTRKPGTKLRFQFYTPGKGVRYTATLN